MEEYCCSDVDNLRRGCACFRRELINISGLNPVSEFCTIAQAFSKVWRKNHMPENSIAIIPPEGYPNQKNYSIKAVRWIQSEAKTRGIKIKHALNGGEQRIMDIMWMSTMKNLELYLNSMDVTGMDALLIFQTETEFNIISV